MSYIIQTNNLHHVYSAGTPFETDALHGISFGLTHGAFAGIIGHTGSGKSTFIQHLNGLLKPTDGTVTVDGSDIWESKQTALAARFKVGLVFQYPEYQLFEETVFKDIAFGPRNMRLSEAEIEERVHEAAVFAGLSEDFLSKSPFMLSGGEKRRVAIAGVIAMRPEVLILDEPTAGLDPAGRELILNNLRRWHRDTGGTLLLVTHSMEEIAEYVSEIFVFNDGSIEMNGTPEEIFSKSERLREIGLDVPEITQVVLRLNELGLGLDPSIHTVKDAVRAINKLM